MGFDVLDLKLFVIVIIIRLFPKYVWHKTDFSAIFEYRDIFDILFDRFYRSVYVYGNPQLIYINFYGCSI